MYKWTSRIGNAVLLASWIRPHNSKTILSLLGELDKSIVEPNESNKTAFTFAHKETKYANRVFKRQQNVTNVVNEAYNSLQIESLNSNIQTQSKKIFPSISYNFIPKQLENGIIVNNLIQFKSNKYLFFVKKKQILFYILIYF